MAKVCTFRLKGGKGGAAPTPLDCTHVESSSKSPGAETLQVSHLGASRRLRICRFQDVSSVQGCSESEGLDLHPTGSTRISEKASAKRGCRAKVSQEA